MERAEVNRSTLAAKVGIDRSTLSQLLSKENDRLPRADTVAAIASTLQVSLDWLLGLTHEERLGANILEKSFQIQPRSPVDEDLMRWHGEATGYKIRYVPQSLPDQVKTPAVIAFEYGELHAVDRDQAQTRQVDRLTYSRLPETDIEICMPVQALCSLARGEDIWAGLPLAARVEQLEEIKSQAQELYPSMRWFLYDGLSHYSAPVTIFGPQRAAIYIGGMYFVFNTTEHIRVLTRHFDGLIRSAKVQPHEIGRYAETLLEELIGGGKNVAAPERVSQ
jgi:transcriptional regulator with XRE-family HTH domain